MCTLFHVCFIMSIFYYFVISFSHYFVVCITFVLEECMCSFFKHRVFFNFRYSFFIFLIILIEYFILHYSIIPLFSLFNVFFLYCSVAHRFIISIFCYITSSFWFPGSFALSKFHFCTHLFFTAPFLLYHIFRHENRFRQDV